MRIMQIITDYIAKSLLTTQGDMLVRGASIPERLVAVALGQVLKSDGVGKEPEWAVDRKTVDIGDWNMDADAEKAIPHGLIRGDIRAVSVIIRNDNNTDTYPLYYFDAGTGLSGTYKIRDSDDSVLVSRTAAGFFDGAAFDATSYNRGWITLWLV